ncbi:MAG: hypothetical protein ACREDL_25605 [Bradyrhizobium sp.]
MDLLLWDQMTGDEKFAEFDEWLGDHSKGLYREIFDLVIVRKMFREVHRIVEANHELRNTPSTFWSWVDALYPTWASMAVRRLSDKKNARPSRSRSFLRFLEELNEQQILSRDRFVAQYLTAALPPDEARSLGNCHFDKCAGRGESHVPGAAIKADIERVIQAAESIRTFTDKRIAHIYSDTPKSPTFGELDKCIDLFEELLRKYVMLFRTTEANILPTNWGFDWMAIFTKPWLPLDDRPHRS